jgi:hypothetical protein
MSKKKQPEHLARAPATKQYLPKFKTQTIR